MKLNELACKNAKPKETAYKLADGNGLFLLIKPDGNKYWRYSYRFAGKPNTYAIGVYDEISLREARDRHSEAHKMVFEGINPNEIKRKKKLEQKFNADNTFESVAEKWLDHKSGEWSDEYRKTIATRLQNDLFPKLGKLPIKSINTPILLNVLKSIEARGVYETTKRAKQYCSQIFRYAIAHGIADADYTVNLSGALKNVKVKHHAALPLSLLPELLNKLDKNEERLFIQTRIAVKLMILTFVRTNELIKAKWAEIDFKNKIWDIPAERMKMRKSHLVPLSKQAIELLKELRVMNGDWDYIFPGQYVKNKTMSDSTILSALYKMGYKGIATGHGFRALAMTALMEKLGYRYEIPDCQLAHSKGDSVRQAYDRTQFLPERIEMMQKWADFVDNLRGVESTIETAKIIKFEVAK